MRVTIPELSLVLLIGPSGSGKSTFAARHFRPTEVLSLDAVRRMIADDDTDEGATEAAWGALLELAARRMSWGHLTVIDADLETAARRPPLLQLAEEQNYISVAFFFGAGAFDGEGFRRAFRFATPQEVAAVEILRLPLWCNRKDESGPFDIIGAVNGRYEELVDLLKELGYRTTPEIAHPGGRKLVFLGDLADGGPGDTNIFRLVMSAVDGGVSYSVPGDCDTPYAGNTEFRSFLKDSVSHYVFDKGGLVVAHAGMKESLQGRGSAAVRDFALHGDGTSSQSAPKWVLEYQGAARVVYSHPTITDPLWLNQTVNLATEGHFTALRYPEMQIVSVAVSNRISYAARN